MNCIEGATPHFLRAEDTRQTAPVLFRWRKRGVVRRLERDGQLFCHNLADWKQWHQRVRKDQSILFFKVSKLAGYIVNTVIALISVNQLKDTVCTHYGFSRRGHLKQADKQQQTAAETEESVAGRT